MTHSPHDTAAVSASGTVLSLSDAEVRGDRGTVFGPLTARSDDPITVALGPRGSGRTSLLLALGGRMRLASGELELLGNSSTGKLSQLRKATGLVGFTGIDELEPSVTVGATLRERLAWALPWYRRAPRVTAEIMREFLAETFGDERLPAPETLVRDLTQAEDRLLRIGLARIESPRVLLVDDFDDIRDPEERRVIAKRIRAFARDGISTVIATADPRDLELFDLDAPQIVLGA